MREPQPPPAALPVAVITDGACTDPDADPEMWFDAHQASYAIDVCVTRCPVLAQCRQWAEAARPEFGVWAGRTPTMRGRREDRGGGP